MLGRKIVDHADELLHVPEPSSNRLQHPLTPCTGAGRRLTADAVFTERTNTTANPNDAVSPPCTCPYSVHIPNTSLTFGVSNPPIVFPGRVEPPCGSIDDASSRSARYSVAEQALSSAFKNSETERSPLELQICSLKQATTALATRAKEARERAAKLKLSLMERETDPNVFVALQQERWKEEKRHDTVGKEVELLTQHLKRLEENRASHPNDDANRVPALGHEAKRSVNLARFFDYSPTRTSFNLDLKCGLTLGQPSPRRMTISDISPLRLRPSSVTPPFRRFTMKHPRPASVAGEALFNPVKRPCRPRLGNSPPDISPLTKSTENIAKASSGSQRSVSHSSRLTSEAPSDGSEIHISTRPSTPPLSVASMGSSSSQGVCEETGGVATIISHVTSRTRSEILADLDKDTVHVPEYAVNLLGGFDLIHDEISLPDRELFIKPREMKPIEVAPPPELADGILPPSEESDTGPYTSFALPPFTVERSRSPSSLNASSSPSTPHLHRPSLQPLTPDSSSFSRSSTPTTPRPSHSSKGPRASHSLLFYMRKHKESPTEHSPASSSIRVESLPGNAVVAGSTPTKKRFSFFSRK